MFCVTASPLSAAQTLSFKLNTVAGVNVTPPAGDAPWATVTFTDHGPNQVGLLLTLDLTGNEFMSRFSFNLDPSMAANSLVFSDVSTVGAFTLPAITLSNDTVKAGQGTRFDVGFDFNVSNSSNGSRRFNETDSLYFIMTYDGSDLFNANSFNYLDATSKNNVIGHIQGIGYDDTSAWLTNTSIPEPQPALLIGVFGLITLLRRRK